MKQNLLNVHNIQCSVLFPGLNRVVINFLSYHYFPKLHPFSRILSLNQSDVLFLEITRLCLCPFVSALFPLLESSSYFTFIVYAWRLWNAVSTYHKSEWLMPVLRHLTQLCKKIKQSRSYEAVCWNLCELRRVIKTLCLLVFVTPTKKQVHMLYFFIHDVYVTNNIIPKITKSQSSSALESE